MNNISLMGRLTASPETIEVNAKSGDTSVTKFTLAINRPGMKDKTDFIRCEAWGRRGEIIAEYVDKGQQLAVTGSLIQDQWEDKDGNKRESFKVKVDNVHLLGGRGGDGGGARTAAASPAEDLEPEGIDLDAILGKGA